MARELGHRVELVVADRLLQPGDVVGLQRLGDAQRRRQGPQAVQLDHDLHLAADGVADLLERLERLVEFGKRDAGAVRGLGGDVERPDLHRR